MSLARRARSITRPGNVVDLSFRECHCAYFTQSRFRSGGVYSPHCLRMPGPLLYCATFYSRIEPNLGSHRAL